MRDINFLDIGCGNGWVVRKVVDSPVCQYAYGIDVSNEMVKLANERRETQKEFFVCSDFNSWEYDGQFDVVFSMETVYYINPLEEAVRKIHKLTKPDGIVIVGIDYYEENNSSKSWSDMVGLEMIRKNIPFWKEVFLQSGFKDVTISNICDPNATERWKQQFGTLVITAKK